jgi:hypothetical protein
MLGNCIIRNPQTLQNTLDKGIICESLLFFGKTHLLIDLSTLNLIVQGQFLDDLIEMLKRGYLTANFSPEFCGLLNENQHGLREHRFIIAKITGDQKGGHLKRNADLLEYHLNRLLNDKAKARNYHRQLCKLLSLEDLADDVVCKIAREDVCDPAFARELGAFSLLNKGIPEDQLTFQRIDVFKLANSGFAIDTDIDFERLGQYVPEEEKKTFGQNDLFPGLIDARLDVHLAARHNAALVGNGKNQVIVDMVLRKSIGGRFNSEEAARAIYDFISVDTPTVRDVINGGARTVRDFISLLDSASVFRKWLSVQNPEKDLVREMLREKTETGWLETLPLKALRFGIFTGVGKLGDIFVPGTSVVLEGFDALVVESLLKRWRPHFFVEHNLKGFLDMERAGAAEVSA